ncbi:E3 ubiquitin-protein ligase ATL42 [Vitis vinifera]|uniref:RING-type E3 ubiquitin transferase n=1 Tax=Vitis vinifera TaxID=29760 RepID=A0A438C275_VITVI|nr:E3 ubiquitin-protein ligase ATL42 [Vitis vinifera]
MNQLGLVIRVLLFFHRVKAQDTSDSDHSGPHFLQPHLMVVVGVLSIMFCLTFLLLAYAKFCHVAVPDFSDFDNHQQNLHGIDKRVMESLPFFRFSSLKGSKEGLECAVCLSKFEEIEVLRLLPNCRHAFHINCIDQWLESHSSCPLCREQDDQGSSRFSIGSSFQKAMNKGKKEEFLIQEGESSNGDYHKLWHKVVIKMQEGVDKKILHESNFTRISRSNSVCNSTHEASTSRLLNPDLKRSMSELTNLSRFTELNTKDRVKELSFERNNAEEERTRKLWLTRAHLTVQWFAGREEIPKNQSAKKYPFNI